MAKKNIFIFLFLFSTICVKAQFAPRAGEPGTTAIHKDSSIFTGWAVQAQLQRGLMDITDPSQGYVSAGTAESTLGKAGENGTVSLGDGGEIILEFNPAILNGPGFDFAVFENGFFYQDSFDFLELAYVEVSTDGIRFVQFPVCFNAQDSVQLLSFEGIDARKIHNLAGKYIFGYGTPFDLDDLIDSTEIDFNNIRFIKIRDVIGNINEPYRNYDIAGKIINDPWPTPFPTGGFDLDAIGVIHQNTTSSVTGILPEINTLYPNPALAGKNIYNRNFSVGEKYILQDILGSVKYNTEVRISGSILLPENLPPSVYILISEHNSPPSRLIIR